MRMKVSGPPEAHPVINFRVRGISRCVRKLSWTSTVIKRKKKMNENESNFLFTFSIATFQTWTNCSTGFSTSMANTNPYFWLLHWHHQLHFLHQHYPIKPLLRHMLICDGHLQNEPSWQQWMVQPNSKEVEGKKEKEIKQNPIWLTTWTFSQPRKPLPHGCQPTNLERTLPKSIYLHKIVSPGPYTKIKSAGTYLIGCISKHKALCPCVGDTILKMNCQSLDQIQPWLR